MQEHNIAQAWRPHQKYALDVPVLKERGNSKTGFALLPEIKIASLVISTF